MSQTEMLTSKAKKAKRSEERFKKSKKRKRDCDGIVEITDTSKPAADEAYAPVIVDDTGKDPAQLKEKKKKKMKKSTILTPTADEAPDQDSAPRPSKKQKPSPTTPVDAAPATTATAPPSKQRFIVFIGNLPYNTTTDSLRAHFKAITPTSIRHRTDPATGKSKGFAFVEFTSFDRMKTCLKLYHHSVFDAGGGGKGEGREKKGRRINVELTAGGGGKGEQRRQKLEVKNVRLEEQRKRRAEMLVKQEVRKEKKGRGAKGADDSKEAKAKAGGKEVREVEVVDATQGMHPARAAMMQKGGR